MTTARSTVDSELVTVWQEVLATTPAPIGSRLRLVLIGTGQLDPLDALGRGANRAVLLNRRGRQIGTQDKRRPFTMETELIGGWGLADELGEGPLTEPIRPQADRLRLFASRAGRLAVLVCEDLARTVEDAALIASGGLSLALAPVLSEPMQPHRWEHRSAKQWAAGVGTTTIVSNSLVIRDRLRAADPDAGGNTAMVHAPGRELGEGSASSADEPMTFRIEPDRTVSQHLVERDG